MAETNMMTRRQVLASLVGIALAGVSHQPRTYGYLTVDGCRARGLNSANARVFLNGVDVTHLKVQAADDRRGFVEFFQRDARGRLLIGAFGRLITGRQYGHVVITFENV